MATNNSIDKLIFSLISVKAPLKEPIKNDVISTPSLPSPTKTTLEEKLSDEAKKTKSKNRCGYGDCKTKLGLVPYECRCKMSFCGEHRLAEQHQCTFDYKALGKCQIEKNNQKIVATKIQKI